VSGIITGLVAAVTASHVGLPPLALSVFAGKMNKKEYFQDVEA